MKATVLHLIDSFRQGGSESQALNLSLEMKKTGRFVVKLACLDRSGPMLLKLPSQEREQIPEFRLNRFYDAQMGRQLYRFARLLRGLSVDVVHTHDFYTNIFGMLAATLACTPVRIASRREALKRPKIKRLAECLAYRAASIVIANCDRVRRDLVAEGVPDEKIVTVHNGVPIEPLSDSNMPPAGRHSRPGVVTIVANLRPVKDHATFLKAARRVVQRRPEVSFMLAGDGDLEPGLREMAATLGIAEQTRFLGRCDDVPGLLERSDVCVLSSQSEGFSNAVLEYMSAGRAVVATRVGGIEEAISDGYNGFLVDPGDDVQMAERITLLLENPDKAWEMGSRNRTVVAERFSRRQQLEKVEALYQNLLNGDPATRAGRARLSGA